MCDRPNEESKPQISLNVPKVDEVLIISDDDEDEDVNNEMDKIQEEEEKDENEDVLTLSSDDEIDGVAINNLQIQSLNETKQVKTEFQEEEELKMHVSDYINNLIQNLDNHKFDDRCKKLEDSYHDLTKDIINISEYARPLAETCIKLATKETHIEGKGIINEDAILSINGHVQRIVKLDPIKRKVAGDLPIRDDQDEPIVLGKLTKISVFDDHEINVVQTKTRAELEEAHGLPKKGPIKRKPLKVGDSIYATANPDKMSLEPWVSGKVDEILKLDGKLHYNVKYDDEYIPELLLKSTQVAYKETPSVMLELKTRVLAHYPYHPSVRKKSSNFGPLYPGLISEVPRRANRFRYLVFFDNDKAAYVQCNHVYLLADDGLIVFDEIPADRKPFLRKYFTNYPERALVKYQIDTKDKVLVDNTFTSGRVKKIDCSLVKFYFRKIDRFEWLYRGSPRLQPLAGLFTNLNRDNETKPNKTRTRKRTGQLILPFDRKQRPFVQYTRDEEAMSENDETSERRPHHLSRQIARRTNDVAGRRIEFELFPEMFIKPQRRHVTNYYKPHRCTENCVINIDEDLKQFRDINPFAIPIILGWERQVATFRLKDRRKEQRAIFYVAPCGRRLRSINEVDTYLNSTKSQLPIDLFTFHTKLNLYSEIDGSNKQGCYYWEPDIAFGLEFHSISCINWLNHTEITPSFQYWPARFPSNGVTLNLDPEFLVSCDCTDNCRDRIKCPCQRLTIESFQILKPVMNLDDDEVGYSHRRLNGVIATGIWECNQNCKCHVNRCPNRVVQHGIRVRLQLFRTEKKGWGIRCLHDIPAGTFICIYAAEVLREDLADEQGTTYGDEYLADLDFIENAEARKENYEEAPTFDLSSDESPSPEHSDDDDDYDEQGRRRRNSRRKAKKNARKRMKREARQRSKPKKPGLPLRKLYNETGCYSLDAKRKGNIGRYFNHSCDPNCFVQNVFIDSHDLRFPWVALFAQKFIPAFTELTWDYNYEILEDRKLWCHCGSSNCRGRLL